MKGLKIMYTVGGWLMALGLIIATIETVVFLFIHGWHWAPVCSNEIWWDHAAANITNAGMLIWAIPMIWILSKIVEGVLDHRISIRKSNEEATANRESPGS